MCRSGFALRQPSVISFCRTTTHLDQATEAALFFYTGLSLPRMKPIKKQVGIPRIVSSSYDALERLVQRRIHGAPHIDDRPVYRRHTPCFFLAHVSPHGDILRRMARPSRRPSGPVPWRPSEPTDRPSQRLVERVETRPAVLRDCLRVRKQQPALAAVKLAQPAILGGEELRDRRVELVLPGRDTYVCSQLGVDPLRLSACQHFSAA